jgi:hypothetical protein
MSDKCKVCKEEMEISCGLWEQLTNFGSCGKPKDLICQACDKDQWRRLKHRFLKPAFVKTAGAITLATGIIGTTITVLTYQSKQENGANIFIFFHVNFIKKHIRVFDIFNPVK